MTISELGSLGEFVGAVLMLATLVYLALQIKFAQKAVRAQTYQIRADSGREFMMQIMHSKELQAIFDKIGLHSWKQEQLNTLEPRERRIIYSYLICWRTHIDNLFYQYQQGNLDQQFYASQEVTVTRFVSAWKFFDIDLRPDLQTEIDRILAKSEVIAQ